MRGSYTQLYVHCVWATWNREPLIVERLEGDLYACFVAKCRELRCEAVAVGGVEDHVHLLVRVHPTIAVAELMREVKGASSHLMTHVLDPGGFFKWQGAYGAFSVSPGKVSDVAQYVENQKAHHREGRVVAEWERWEAGEGAGAG